MKKDDPQADVPAQALAHPLFHGLPQDLAPLLMRDAATLHVQHGDVIFHEGADAREYLFVHHGEVEVLRPGPDGQERMLHIFQPGQMLAESAMFMSHGRYPMMARARGDVIVLCLKRAGLVAVCQAWPDLALRLLTRLSDRVYQRVNEVEWYSDSTAAQRLANYLLRLPRGADHSLSLPLSQRQLAAYLGVRAETLSRQLAEWVAQGHLEGARRQWVLKNPDFLETLAQPARRRF